MYFPKKLLTRIKKYANILLDTYKCFYFKKKLHNKRGGLMKRFVRFCVNIKKELKKVRWPKKKEMVVYSISTICIIMFFMVFFVGIDACLAKLVKVFN